MSRVKRARVLHAAVCRPPVILRQSRTIRVILDDEREPDRVHVLVLTVWEAQRLGQQLLEAARDLPDPQDAP